MRPRRRSHLPLPLPLLAPPPTPHRSSVQKRKTLTAVTSTTRNNNLLPLAQRSPNLPPPAKRQRVKTEHNKVGHMTTAVATGLAAELDAVQTVPPQLLPPHSTSEQLATVPDALIDPRLHQVGIKGVLDEDGVCDTALDSVPVDPTHVSTLSLWALGNVNSGGSTSGGDKEAEQGGDSPAQKLLDDRIEDCIIDQAVERVIRDKEGGGGVPDPTLSKRAPSSDMLAWATLVTSLPSTLYVARMPLLVVTTLTRLEERPLPCHHL